MMTEKLKQQHSTPLETTPSTYDPTTITTRATTRRRLTTTVVHSHPESSPASVPSVTYVSFLCGISSGIIQAGVFNPWDRALYLSITKQTPFLSRENFRNPYLGFFQSVGHRALSGGLFYPLENFFCSVLLPHESFDDDNNKKDDEGNVISSPSSALLKLHPALANFLAGTLAGTCNALIINPVTAIKYKSWSRDVNRGMVTEAVEMFQKGGLRPFTNGLIPTVYRDLVFGGTYTFFRLEIPYWFQLPSYDDDNDHNISSNDNNISNSSSNSHKYQWAANMTAAALATVVSGPFNLARNVQYATRSRHQADSVSKVLTDFVDETMSQQTLFEKVKYLQRRLRIGWGTVRVAVGMSFGQILYDSFMGLYQDRFSTPKDARLAR